MTRFLPDPGLLDSPRHRDWPAYPTPVAADVAGRPPESADVVIVGAGPAGLAVAAALWHLDVRDVVLVDRDGRPAGRFHERVDRLDQRVLRSPYEHHPGVEGYRDCELRDFARMHWALLTPVERREVRMSQAGHRSVVPVDVFEAYCRHTAAIHRVPQRLWRAEITSLAVHDDHVSVRGAGVAITARYVVLCQGEERRDGARFVVGRRASRRGRVLGRAGARRYRARGRRRCRADRRAPGAQRARARAPGGLGAARSSPSGTSARTSTRRSSGPRAGRASTACRGRTGWR